MLFKKISIPITKIKSLQKIAGKNFDFTNKHQYAKAANFVILIGNNGSGKSTLITLLKMNYYWWDKVINFPWLREMILWSENNSERNHLQIDLYMNGLTYCCDFFLKNDFQISNNFDFNKFDTRTMKLNNIHINKYQTLTLDDFIEKINSEKISKKFVFLPAPNYYGKIYAINSNPIMKSNNYANFHDFDVDFDKSLALYDIKYKIEEYLSKHINYVKNQEKNNSVLPKSKQVDPNFLETDFKKITNDLYKLTNLQVKYSMENEKYKLTIKEEGQNIDCNFENWVLASKSYF